MIGLVNKFTLILLLAVTGAVSASGTSIAITEFSESSLQGWESKSFVGTTDYQFTKEGDQTVLVATASAAASGLGKKIRIDLEKTPYINWSWKIDNRLSGLDEATKEGDDYVARLYVVNSGGVFIWKAKSLNYVWSSNQSKEQIWPNAYRPKNSIMLSVRGSEDPTGQWVTEKRNVLNDLKKVFGNDIDTIDAVAIMTDTDNSGRSASAAYGEIFFTDQ